MHPRVIHDQLLSRQTVTSGVLAAGQPLLDLIPADGAVLKVGCQVDALGGTPDVGDATRIMICLLGRSAEDVAAIEPLGRESAEFESLKATGSGARLLPLLNNPGDGIFRFREPALRQVLWGGDPVKPLQFGPSTGGPSPRTGFAAWREPLSGGGAPCTRLDLALAWVLRRTISNAMLHRAESQLAYPAQFDPLTGLADRPFIEAHLAPEPAGESHLIVIDLFRFQALNDAHAHTAGHDFFKEVAQRLEALLRWVRPRLGSVPPAEFIAVAEETGLIRPVGAWDLELALAQPGRCRAQGLGICVPVNGSGHQVASPDSTGRVGHAGGGKRAAQCLGAGGHGTHPDAGSRHPSSRTDLRKRRPGWHR